MYNADTIKFQLFHLYIILVPTVKSSSGIVVCLNLWDMIVHFWHSFNLVIKVVVIF
jgi:hypothetical protein